MNFMDDEVQGVQEVQLRGPTNASSETCSEKPGPALVFPHGERAQQPFSTSHIALAANIISTFVGLL